LNRTKKISRLHLGFVKLPLPDAVIFFKKV
jgi:hypothetical protein